MSAPPRPHSCWDVVCPVVMQARCQPSHFSLQESTWETWGQMEWKHTLTVLQQMLKSTCSFFTSPMQNTNVPPTMHSPWISWKSLTWGPSLRDFVIVTQKGSMGQLFQIHPTETGFGTLPWLNSSSAHCTSILHQAGQPSRCCQLHLTWPLAHSIFN